MPTSLRKTLEPFWNEAGISTFYYSVGMWGGGRVFAYLWMAFVCVCGWWTICRQPVRFVYRFVGFLTWSTTLSSIVAAQSDRTSLTDTNVQASCKVLSPTKKKKRFLGWRVWLILFISKFLFQFGLFHFLALKATVENETFVFETGNS